jgi:hypothetical protein
VTPMSCTIVTRWRTLSLSAWVLVDPVSGARGIVRDTRADGAYRFHWRAILSEESLPIATGRTGGSHRRLLERSHHPACPPRTRQRRQPAMADDLRREGRKRKGAQDMRPLTRQMISRPRPPINFDFTNLTINSLVKLTFQI